MDPEGEKGEDEAMANDRLSLRKSSENLDRMVAKFQDCFPLLTPEQIISFLIESGMDEMKTVELCSCATEEICFQTPPSSPLPNLASPPRSFGVSPNPVPFESTPQHLTTSSSSSPSDPLLNSLDPTLSPTATTASAATDYINAVSYLGSDLDHTSNPELGVFSERWSPSLLRSWSTSALSQQQQPPPQEQGIPAALQSFSDIIPQSLEEEVLMISYVI